MGCYFDDVTSGSRIGIAVANLVWYGHHHSIGLTISKTNIIDLLALEVIMK